MSDYLGSSPGIDVSSGGAGNNTVSIRGISTGQQTVSTVAIYVDDLAFGSSSAYANGAQTALDLSLLDLNRIEVLRGPQGTLYGAGAMGGLLKYITNEPDTYRFSGKASFSVGGTKGGGISHTENAVVNVPLKEDVAGLRIALFHDREGGYVDAKGAASATNVNRGDSSGGRVSLLLEPSSGLRVKLTALSKKIDRQGHDYVDYGVATGRPVNGEHEHVLTRSEPYSTQVQLVSASLEYNLKWARFEAITSSQTSSFRNNVDYSGVYTPLLPGTNSVLAQLDSSVRKQTQEFRLTSASSPSLEWLAGVFYTHEKGVNDQTVSSTLSAGGSGPLIYSAALPSTFREVAAYGDVTWKITPRLSLTGGLRIARNEQRFSQTAGGLLGGDGSTIRGESAETSKTYLATASYALTSTSNVYARAASGYRPGGPNLRVSDPNTGEPLVPTSFKHDALWSYEAGYKADLLDKKLALEAALYDIRWSDIQHFASVNGLGVIVNGGKAEVKGAELSARYKASQNFSVNGSLAYLDAHLTENSGDLATAGAVLPNSPRLSLSVGANYTFSVAGHPAFVGGSMRHVGNRNSGFEGSASQPSFKMPGYALADVQAGMDFRNLKVSMYVRNVFDRRAILSASTQTVALGGPVWATLAQPRTMGVVLSSEF